MTRTGPKKRPQPPEDEASQFDRQAAEYLNKEGQPKEPTIAPPQAPGTFSTPLIPDARLPNPYQRPGGPDLIAALLRRLNKRNT